MKSKKKILIKLRNDIKNGTSHSVDYLLGNDVNTTLSKYGIKIIKIFAPLLRLIYKTQTEYRIIKEPGVKSKKGKKAKYL